MKNLLKELYLTQNIKIKYRRIIKNLENTFSLLILILHTSRNKKSIFIQWIFLKNHKIKLLCEEKKLFHSSFRPINLDSSLSELMLVSVTTKFFLGK